MDLPREDLLSEHYRDEGCEFDPYCLNCPFPRCVEDLPRGRQRQRKEIRSKEILHLFYAQGEGVKEIARKLKVSQRTVQRALQDSKSSHTFPTLR